MPERRYRVLIISTHPVQYAAPLMRQLSQDPRLDIEVAYCSLQGAAVSAVDPEFGVEVKWDVPLLEGFHWVHVPNRSPWPGLGRFFGLINPGLWKLIRTGKYDAVFIRTGYAILSFWIVVAAARFSGIPLMGGSDAYNVAGASPRWWKSLAKRIFLPLVYRSYSVILLTSQSTVRFLQSMGMPKDRIAYFQGGFDIDWWAREAGKTDRSETRAKLGIPPSSMVFLFCAKLVPRKRPQDVLRAFAQVKNTGGVLVFAGDGSMRSQLVAEAEALGVSKRVVFCGFVNLSRLPGFFRAADLMVLSSEWDGGPLVVGEAMSCGCPVILSDSIPGRFELVRHGETGFVYPCGNEAALASILSQVLEDPERVKQLSSASLEMMKGWSLPVYVEGFVRVMDQFVGVRKRQLKEQKA